MSAAHCIGRVTAGCGRPAAAYEDAKKTSRAAPLSGTRSRHTIPAKMTAVVNVH